MSKKLNKTEKTLFPKPPSPQRRKSRSKSRPKPKTLYDVKSENKAKKDQKTNEANPVENTKEADKIQEIHNTNQFNKVKDVPKPPEVPKAPEQPPRFEEPEIDEQETSQMWILRHLRLRLEDIEDSVLTKFIYQQDVTPFRNFMMDFSTEFRCIFILVCRNIPQLIALPENVFAMDIESSRAQTIPDTQRTQLSVPQVSPVPPPEKAPPPPPQPTKIEKVMKPRKKSKTRPKKKPDKQDKQEDLEKEKREEEAKKEIIEEIIQTQFSAEEESELQLKWFSARKIPDETDEFILIVSRLEEKQSEKSELDQSYFVGYIRNARQFKRAVEIGASVLGEKMTFERRIDMLLYGVNAMAGSPSYTRERWQSRAEKFENFIIDSIGHFYWQSPTSSGRSESVLSLTDQKSAIESVESLLRPRIQAFVKNPVSVCGKLTGKLLQLMSWKQAEERNEKGVCVHSNIKTRVQLWLEMSLYELKFVTPEDSAEIAEERMSRICAIFQTLDLLISESESKSAKEWLQKALFYSIELTARIIGTNLKDTVDELTSPLFRDTGREVDEEVRGKLKPIFSKLLEIGSNSVFPQSSEEYGVLENIKHCLMIFEYIEEEVEKISKLMEYLRSPEHDMLIDRTPINAAFDILDGVRDIFQETYFESALESGNIETMKTVCLKLSADQEKLKAIKSDLKNSKL